MSKQLFANNAVSTLANSLGVADATLTLATGDGSKFPNPSNGNTFLVTVSANGLFEILLCTARNGDVLTITRAQENTAAQAFAAGSTVEMTVTAGTLASFARLVDRMDRLASVTGLLAPNSMNSNSYLCGTIDDDGNQVMAVADAGGFTWRFPSHPRRVIAGTTTGGTANSITSASITNQCNPPDIGKFIVQFTSSSYTGQARIVTTSSTGTLGWAENFGSAIPAGIAFEVYESIPGALNDLFAEITGSGGDFSVTQQYPSSMSLTVNTGRLFDGTTYSEHAAQTLGPITAPTGNSRIDLVVLNQSGVASIVAGTEAVSPVAPAVPAGSIPLARIPLSVGQTTIINGNIIDERAGRAGYLPYHGDLLDVSSALVTVKTALQVNGTATVTSPPPGDSSNKVATSQFATDTAIVFALVFGG